MQGSNGYVEFNTTNGVYEEFILQYNQSATVTTGQRCLYFTVDGVILNNFIIKDLQIDGSVDYRVVEASVATFTNMLITNCQLLNINSLASNSAKVLEAFLNCNNLTKCLIDNFGFNAGTGYTMRLFRACTNLYNCRIIRFYATGAVGSYSVVMQGFFGCTTLFGCSISGVGTVINTTAGTAFIGFSSCDYLTTCSVESVASSETANTAFSACEFLVNCYVKNISSNPLNAATAFNQCLYLDNCWCDSINFNSSQGTGFSACERIVNAYALNCGTAGSGTANLNAGFYNCKQAVNCRARFCTYGFCKGSQYQNCWADTNTSVGFASCWPIFGCRSSSNGSNYGVSVFADWGGTSAVADTAAGGWNG